MKVCESKVHFYVNGPSGVLANHTFPGDCFSYDYKIAIRFYLFYQYFLKLIASAVERQTAFIGKSVDPDDIHKFNGDIDDFHQGFDCLWNHLSYELNVKIQFKL